MARDPKHFQEPKIPDSIKEKNITNWSKWSLEEKKTLKKFRNELNEHRKFSKECYSLWCDTVYKLSIASHFKDEIMFFPHNIDFRGRVYPIAPYFHHMGGDLSRSVLIRNMYYPIKKSGYYF